MSTGNLRAITVRQPWAWAITHGGKDVENRSRNIAGDYRGPVLIHAGQTFDQRGAEDPHILEAVKAHPGPGYALVHAGAVIGVVDLVGVHHDHDSDECMGGGLTDSGAYLSCSPWAMADHHHLVLTNPRPLRHPIPARGQLGLWTPDPALTATIRRQVNL